MVGRFNHSPVPQQSANVPISKRPLQPKIMLLQLPPPAEIAALLSAQEAEQFGFICAGGLVF